MMRIYGITCTEACCFPLAVAVFLNDFCELCTWFSKVDSCSVL